MTSSSHVISGRPFGGLIVVLALAFVAPVLGAEDDRSADKRKFRDGRLANRVEVELAESRTIWQRDLDVTAEERVVTLRGRVNSGEAKQRAARIAGNVTGVVQVRNQLTIDEAVASREQPPSDDVLVPRVAKKIAQAIGSGRANEQWLFGWEVQGVNWDFDVEADDGEVELNGEVGTYAQYIKAIRAARDTPGVRSVDADDLELKNEFGEYDPFDPAYWDRDYDYGLSDYDWDNDSF